MTGGQALAITSADALPLPQTELDDAENWDATESVGEAEDGAPKARWELKKLTPLHKNVASLIAQGKKNVDVAAICNITPEYVSMLLRQPLVKAHVAAMCEVVGVRLEALFDKTVDVIADQLQNGSEASKLKAARLQLEATKRIGSHNPIGMLASGASDRLVILAERLLALQSGVRKGRVLNEDGTEVSEA